jgi:hypothetical protein
MGQLFLTVGALKDLTITPCGFSLPNTSRVNPSFHSHPFPGKSAIQNVWILHIKDSAGHPVLQVSFLSLAFVFSLSSPFGARVLILSRRMAATYISFTKIIPLLL